MTTREPILRHVLRGLLAASLLLATLAHADPGGELGSLRIDHPDDAHDSSFVPTEFLDYRATADRRGQRRLQGTWRMSKGGPVPPMFTVVQFAAGEDGDPRLGVSLLVNHDRWVRNYSAGCSPPSRKDCDPAALGLVFDRASGELRIDARFERLTLEDGAEESVHVTGVLRVRGAPAVR